MLVIFELLVSATFDDGLAPKGDDALEFDLRKRPLALAWDANDAMALGIF